MKKSLALAMIGSMAAISQLSAQVNIYLAGSTAFRANAVRAITNLYGANITSQNDGNAAHTYPTDVTGASVVTFTGTIPSLFSSQTVNIKCYWSGSAQGIHSLCNGDILPFERHLRQRHAGQSRGGLHLLRLLPGFHAL